MAAGEYLIALDQGTTSTRAIAFGLDGTPLGTRQLELSQHYPEPAWVEHDAEEICAAAVRVVRELISDLGDARPLALGITNQRETTVLWDRKTGKPAAKAIVWQDRRTADICRALREAGHEELVRARSGLLLDPYFSATKLAWMLDRDNDLRERAERGELAFGTVESFLIWRLGGGAHLSDATNASRTMLLDIHSGEWDDDLLALFGVPRAILPEVVDNAGAFARTDASLLGIDIPISGAAGDQQAAAIGQACISPDAVKSTYGTGCFLLQNTGAEAPLSDNRLLTTVAFQVGGERRFALEGSIFVAGAAVQWLRDSVGLIETAPETEEMAAGLEDNRGVYLVPAFVGLGAPHWDAEARGAIYGLTPDSGRREIVRAALEAVCYQTHDLLEAAGRDGAGDTGEVRVDGGMAANGWLMQFLADTLDRPVDRPKVIETTALGAAFLAGLGAGIYSELSDVRGFWQLDQRFEPQMPGAHREANLRGWREALGRTLSRRGPESGGGT